MPTRKVCVCIYYNIILNVTPIIPPNIIIINNSPLKVPYGLMDVLDAAGEALGALGPILVVPRLAVDAPDSHLPGDGRDLVPAGAELGFNLLGRCGKYLELGAEQTQVGREPRWVVRLRHEEVRPDGMGRWRWIGGIGVGIGGTSSSDMHGGRRCQVPSAYRQHSSGPVGHSSSPPWSLDRWLVPQPSPLPPVESRGKPCAVMMPSFFLRRLVRRRSIARRRRL